MALVQIFKMLKYHSIDHQGSKSERLSYFNKRQPPPKTRGIGSETKYTNTTAKKTNIWDKYITKVIKGVRADPNCVSNNNINYLPIKTN